MRRVLAACWGTDSSQWVGRRVRLFCDPDVIFGKDKVGGTRIAALSNIDVRRTIPLLVSRGKSAAYTVEPLVEKIERDWHAEADALTDADSLRALYLAAPKDSEAREYIAARAKSLALSPTPPSEQIDTATGEVTEPTPGVEWPEVARPAEREVQGDE